MDSERTLLVTGGAGFVGSNFVRFAVARGYAVVNLDLLTYAGNLDNLAALAGDARHVFVRGDIGDRALVAQLLEAHRPRAVVHFAAESHVDRSIDEPSRFVRTNVLGTFELLEASRRYWRRLEAEAAARFRFVHVSTDEVFGSLGATGAFAEDAPYAPSSPYAASKASADHFVRAAHQTYGLPTITTNSSNAYGPNQFPEKLIPLIVANALEGKPLPVYGDGSNVRDWLYVEDLCDAIAQVLERGAPGARFNVGGGGERTNLALVRSVCALLDELAPRATPHADAIVFVADRPGHDRRYAIDARLLESTLGWRPTIGLDEGLRRTVRWYVENRAWCARVAQGEYRRERLGLGSD